MKEMKYFDSLALAKRGVSQRGGASTPDSSGCGTPSSSSGGGNESGGNELSWTVGVTESTPYGCQFCDKAFPRLSYLKRHEQIHSDQMPFRCDYCQRLFKHKRSRDRHVKLHTGDRKYRCGQCESAFSRSDHLKIHLRTHDNGKPYQCAVCNRGYNTAAALSSHMQNHKVRTEAQQQVLDLRNGLETEGVSSPAPLPPSSPALLRSSFSSSSPLSSSEGGKACGVCLDELASPNAHCTHHRKSNSDPDPPDKRSPDIRHPRFSPAKQLQHQHLSCDFCSKSDFPSGESLQLHLQVVHRVPTPQHQESALAASIRSLQSMFAGKRLHQAHAIDNFLGAYSRTGLDLGSLDPGFSAIQLLQKQQADALRKRDLQCTQCNTGFTTPAALLEHVQTAHETLVTNHGKRTLASPRLRPNGVKHVKSSHSPHSTMFNGTSHYRRQDPGGGASTAVPPGGNNYDTNQSTLLCSQCSAGFSDFESFRAHLKSHLDAAASGPRAPLAPCPECGAELPTAQLLDTHLATHFLSESTEYGCAQCAIIFGKAEDLQRHLMEVHCQQLFKCSLCGQEFDSKVSIQVHFAVKHSNDRRTLKWCTACSATFRTETEFQVHVKLNHLSSASTKPCYHRCLLCDQAFPTEAQLRFHADTHAKEFPCSACGEAFHVEFLLDRHIQEVHQRGEAASPVKLLHPQDQEDLVAKTSISSDEAQDLCMKKMNGPSKVEQSTPPDHQMAQPPSTHTPSSSPVAKSPPTSHRCDICDVTCATEWSLAQHRRQAHHLRQPSKDQPGAKASNGSAVSLFCAYCNESCKSRAELENHMKTHTATPSKHKCNICDEICPSATTLAEHKLTHCKVVSGSTCIVCRVHLSSEDQFLSHLHLHGSPSLPVPCVICRQTLVVDIEAKMHARFHLHHPSSTPCCVVCSRTFPHSGSMVMRPPNTYMCKDCFHSKTGLDLRCDECGVKFETVEGLEVHRRTLHLGGRRSEVELEVEKRMEKNECRLCREVLDSPTALQCHLIEHSFEGSTHFTCYLCSVVFASSALLQKHMIEHGLDSRPYDCSECESKFFFRAELDNHSFVHASSWDGRNNATTKENGDISHRLLYECPKCPSIFHSFVELARHQRSSHNGSTSLKQEPGNGRSQVPCPESGMEFQASEDVKGHLVLQHTSPFLQDRVSLQDFYKFEEDKPLDEKSFQNRKEKKTFECPVCKKRFTRRENKKLHMKSHHPQNFDSAKTFPCPRCEKVFLKRSQIKEHIQQQHPSTNCDICDESFPSSSNLRLHLANTHHRTFEYTCVVCSEPFDHEADLLQHQENQHQVAVEEILRPKEEPKTETESSSCPASPDEDPKEEDVAKCPKVEVVEDSVIAGDSELTVETDYGDEVASLATEVAA
ncbi:hypothetical protein JTE90_007402 [Oedothorax gibbosus]|uniref:C2H2-type domain-containing protein n=1 Tax=Oedothorax gibbosus TaxID=931172 RepID=A0AAV6UJM5_9ARAC|nr:hypothetical protein JTE90_007402 [Oedothorax gibbosus]